MPVLSATAEPTDGKESWITFTYTAETATRPFDSEAKSKKEYNCATKTSLATTTI